MGFVWVVGAGGGMESGQSDRGQIEERLMNIQMIKSITPAIGGV